MKRFAFWFVASLIAVSWVTSSRRPPRHEYAPRTAHARSNMIVRTETGPGRKPTIHILDHDRRIVTIDAAGVHLPADDERRRDRDDDEDDDRDGNRLGPADDLPVEVVQGSRVTEARIEAPRAPEPPAPPRPVRARRGKPSPPEPPAQPRPPVSPAPQAPEAVARPLVVAGRLSATEERAVKDARVQLLSRLRVLLGSSVPRGWPVPGRLIDGMIRETKVVPVERDYGTVYQATMLVDASPHKSAEIVEAYRHEQVVHRLTTLGGLLAFVLVCLGTLSGYIRADEATRGYYTNRLRLAAAAGVGAAGTAIYQMLT